MTPWKFGTSTAPSFVSFVSSEEKKQFGRPLRLRNLHLSCTLFDGADIEARWQDPGYPWEIVIPQMEDCMNNIGHTTLVFLTGLGIGAGFAALFAPRSGKTSRDSSAHLRHLPLAWLNIPSPMSKKFTGLVLGHPRVISSISTLL
jgi:hypothetical protein